jgi:hypothetical protein
MGGSQSTSNTLRTISWRNYGDISDEAKLSQNLNKYLETNLGKGYDTPVELKVDPNDQKKLDEQKARNKSLIDNADGPTDEELFKIIGKFPSFNGNYRIPAEKRILPQAPTFINPPPYFIDDGTQAAASYCDRSAGLVPDLDNDPTGQTCIQKPRPPGPPDLVLDNIQNLKDDLDKIFLAFQAEPNVANVMNGSFDKNLKFYIRDDVFMKYSGDTLRKLQKEVNIGTEVPDLGSLHPEPGKGDAVKKEVVDELTDYYVSKLNIMANILSIIDYMNTKVKTIKKGPICMAPNKQLLQNTQVDYSLPINASVLGANTKDIYEFAKDIDNIREQILENIFTKEKEILKNSQGNPNCTIDPAILDQLRDMVQNVKQLTAIEITDPGKCTNEPGFIWLADETEVFNNKMFIDEAANEAWLTQYENVKNVAKEQIINLREFLLTLLISKPNPADVTLTTYFDKPLSKPLLKQAIKDSRDVIINALIAFDKAFLELYKTPMESLSMVDPNKAQIARLESEIAKLKGINGATCSS